MPQEFYQSQEKRNARAKALKAEGKQPRRSSVRGQLLHPMYVQDAKSDPADARGLNGVYDTYWPVLYKVSW